MEDSLTVGINTHIALSFLHYLGQRDFDFSCCGL